MKTSAKTTKIALIGGALAAALALSTSALARPWGHGPDGPGGPGGPGGMIMRLFGQLDLSDQQELKAIKIRRNLQQQGQEMRQEMRAQLAGVVDELEKPNPDAVKLHGVVDEVAKRALKMAHSAVDQLLELHGTLSPEQRETLVEHARQAQERMSRFEEDRPAKKGRK